MDDSIPLFFTQKWDTNKKKFNITVEPTTPYLIYIYTVLRLLASAALKLIQLFARGRTNDALQQEGEEECLLYKRESDDGPLILASMMA